MLLVQSYKNDPAAVARHLRWPQAKVQAAMNYAEAFAEEIDDALKENEASDFVTIKRMLPQTMKFNAGKAAKS